MLLNLRGGGGSADAILIDAKSLQIESLPKFKTHQSFTDAKVEVAKKIGMEKDDFHIIRLADQSVP